MSNNVIKRSLAGVVATLNSAVSALQTKIVSGKFAIINARSVSANLNTIYEEQDGSSVAFIEGQNELNAPIDGTLHFVLSFKFSANYGLQFAILQSAPTTIYIRKIHAGTWQAWDVWSRDAGKAVISAQFTANYTVGANTYKNITTSDLSASIPSGYTPFAVIAVSTGANGVAFRQVSAASLSSSNGVVIVARNLTSSEVTANATIRVGFIKSDLLSS